MKKKLETPAKGANGSPTNISIGMPRALASKVLVRGLPLPLPVSIRALRKAETNKMRSHLKTSGLARRKSKGVSRPDSLQQHLSTEEVAVFVDGQISSKERKVLIEHLDLCVGCRNIVTRVVSSHAAVSDPDDPSR